MFAVIKTGGKQYRVAPGDTIRIERVKGDVGEKVTFGSVLAVHNEDKKLLSGSDASKATVTGACPTRRSTASRRAAFGPSRCQPHSVVRTSPIKPLRK